MNPPRCYFIGNTHIDHTWVWHWTEGYDEVQASFRAVLERMEEFPEFVFTAASSLHYRWIEENDPAMFAEIQQRVAEERWQLAGGWVVQSDNNLPCGEAFVRQGLYGQGYFQSRFGKTAQVGYCVDSFGHHAQLPQILRGQGLTGWLHFRPDPSELSLPWGPYRWRGIDGTEVVACRPPGWYCTPHEAFFETTARAIPEHLEAYPEVLFFYGVGDHGGGPTRRDLEWMRRFHQEHPEWECIYGGLDEFFQRAAEQGKSLPVVRKELQYSFRGCYTTNGRLKALNRQAEGRLLMAEKMAALAAMHCEIPYLRTEINRAWDHLLTNHFHDVICGTCTQEAMEEALFRYGGVLETAERVRHFATKRLTSRFDRRPPAPFTESLALVVVNSLSWDRREPVEFYPHTPGRSIASPAVVDAAGNPVDFQRTEPPFGTPGPAKSLLFVPPVPAGGMALFHVVESGPDRPAMQTTLKSTDASLENYAWRIAVDPATGTLRSLFDKRRNLELVCPGAYAADLLVMKDLGDTWGTGRSRFGDQIGRFTALAVRCMETGPLRARLEIRSEYGRSTAVQRISLYRDGDWVDFDLEVLWNDCLKAVKIAFPLALERSRSFYEIPYGAVERPTNGEEQPMQTWLQVRGKLILSPPLSHFHPSSPPARRDLSYAVGFAADSIGGADVLYQPEKGTEVRLTLLRSPYHGYLTFEDAVEGLDRTVSDQGVRRVRYRLLAGGGRANLGLPEHGAALSQPVQIALEGCQAGATVQPLSYFRCRPAAVHLTALKQAEDGQGFIARLVETRGRRAVVTVSGPEGYLPIQASLRPFEIQTWRWRRREKPARCDLLENAVHDGEKSALD